MIVTTGDERVAAVVVTAVEWLSPDEGSDNQEQHTSGDQEARTHVLQLTRGSTAGLGRSAAPVRWWRMINAHTH